MRQMFVIRREGGRGRSWLLGSECRGGLGLERCAKSAGPVLLCTLPPARVGITSTSRSMACIGGE